MTNLTTSRFAAVAGIILCLPITLIYVIAVNNIEPINSFFINLTTSGDRPKSLALALIIGALLLLPIALAVNLVPVVRSAKAGAGVLAQPANVAVALISIVAIAYLWGRLIIDQIPCFMGVPNCD